LRRKRPLLGAILRLWLGVGADRAADLIEAMSILELGIVVLEAVIKLL
jgi:hypothetical protein